MRSIHPLEFLNENAPVITYISDCVISREFNFVVLEVHFILSPSSEEADIPLNNSAIHSHTESVHTGSAKTPAKEIYQENISLKSSVSEDLTEEEAGCFTF